MRIGEEGPTINDGLLDKFEFVFVSVVAVGVPRTVTAVVAVDASALLSKVLWDALPKERAASEVVGFLLFFCPAVPLDVAVRGDLLFKMLLDLVRNRLVLFGTIPT